MEKHYILTLLNTQGIGKGTVRKMLDKSIKPSATKDLRDYLEDLKNENARIKVPSLDQLYAGEEIADQILNKSESSGIKIISFTDKLFPERYRNIPNAPVMIHVKGNVDCLSEEKSIAIIGTREPSDYGYSIGKRYGKLFAENNINVISGLAKGCDASGHEGCLEGNGTTIAILAGGLEKVYPKENIQLAERILENGGALVSEYQIGIASQASFFVERDRLQSGLSKALLVIETDIKGGTMHTVGFAIEQKVPVYFDYTKFDERKTFPKFQGNIFMVNEKKALPINNKEDFETLVSYILKTGDNSISIEQEKEEEKIIMGRNNQIEMF